MGRNSTADGQWTLVCTGQWNRQFCKCPNQDDDKCKWLFSLLSCLLLVSCVVNFMSQQVECPFKCGKGAATTTTTTTPTLPQCAWFTFLFSFSSFFCLTATRKTWDCFVRISVCYGCVCVWVSVCVSELMCVLHNVLKNKWDIYFHCRLLIVCS